MSNKIPIVHIINSFEFGGAEAMLGNLLLRTDRDKFEPSVVSLIDDMTVAEPVIRAGVPIAVMGMKPGVPNPRAVLRLAMHLRRLRPAVVQTWMDHSNLIGGVAARMATKAKIVWGIHHSHHVKGLAKRSTLLTVAACGKLSRFVPDQIVSCSEHAKTQYGASGFAADKLTVIPNGFNTKIFRPDADARARIRAEIGVDQTTMLIGLAARYDPVKDPTTFLKAAAILAKQFPGARFVICGAKMDWENAELVAEIKALNLKKHCILLGPRRDVSHVHAAMDVVVLSSVSEAFPLVLGEAMACGVPCVSTNVGDAALIVGDTGHIVPVQDPSALAAACAKLLEMATEQRVQLGLTARQRICELFDLDAVTRRYEYLYHQLVLANSSGEPTCKPVESADLNAENVVI